MKNKVHIILTVFIAVGIVAVVVWVVFGLESLSPEKQAEQRSKAEQTAIKTYVPIAHYTSELEETSLEEIKKLILNKTIAIPSDESDDIAQLFGMEISQLKTGNLDEILTDLASKKQEIALVRHDQVNFKYKTLIINKKYLWDKETTDYPLQLETNSLDGYQPFDASKITTLTSVGDVILSRHVAQKMKEYRDYTHPWLLMAKNLKNSDITYIDLEAPFSDRVSPPTEGMSFVVPTAAIAGLELAGVDIVSLANNHSTNFGRMVFADSLNLLKSKKILYVGGSDNLAEAQKAVIIEKNGIKIAFLSANAIIGAIGATESASGTFEIALKPWSKVDSETDMVKVEELVKAAKKTADVVVVGFHWGVEYQTQQSQSQKVLADRTIDAGADLIIGTHPHTVQGVESHNNGLIFYSLGNFIFDQEWSIETKQGIFTKTYLYGDEIVSSPIYAYQIEDYNQPRPANDAQEATIKNRLFSVSGGPYFNL